MSETILFSIGCLIFGISISASLISTIAGDELRALANDSARERERLASNSPRETTPE